MHRNWQLVGVVALCLLLVGCAAGSTAGSRQAPAAPTPVPSEGDPVALIGSWTVQDADGERGAVLRIAAGQLMLFRRCGALMGSWQADRAGLFVADLNSTTGCSPSGQPTPAWLQAASAFRVESIGPVLLDGRGAVVARLLPGGRPSPQPDMARDLTEPPVVTDDVRRAFAPPVPLPAALTPATRDRLVGRWIPVGSTEAGQAYVELRGDGGWSGSDGCNGQRGRWVAGSQGALLAVAGPSTLVGCLGVAVASWLSATRRAGLDDGGALVLTDGRGQQIGRLRPAG
jgi:hypothetical protein